MLNEDAFASKGIAIPERLTVSQLRTLANELKSDEYEYAFALDAGNIHGIVQNAVIDTGFVKEDGTSNLDHPNVREGLETYYGLMHEDKVMPVLAIQKATNMAVEQMFLEGKIAMYKLGGGLRMSNDLKQYPRAEIAFVYPHLTVADHTM